MAADLQYSLGLSTAQYVASASAANAATGGLNAKIMGLANQGLGMAATQLGGFGNMLTKIGGPAKGLAVVLALVGLSLKVAGKEGNEIKGIATILGETTENAVRLSNAFKIAGMEAGAITSVFSIMARAVAGVSESGEPTNKMLAQLGLSQERLLTMSPAEQFKALGAAIAGIENPTQRANAAMKVFGKSGAALIEVFTDDDAMKALTADLGNKGKLMAENAEKFEKYYKLSARAWSNLKGAGGFFTGVASRWADIATPLLEKIAKLDLSRAGEWVGELTAKIYYLHRAIAALVEEALAKLYNFGLEFAQRFGMFKGVKPKDTAGLEGESRKWADKLGQGLPDHPGGAKKPGSQGADGAGGSSLEQYLYKIKKDPITALAGVVGRQTKAATGASAQDAWYRDAIRYMREEVIVQKAMLDVMKKFGGQLFNPNFDASAVYGE
ncbi:MAG: hypothetical protein NT105_23690 [Verrucomicrobia bacterium]|nr:hypothetical protein [Verrucomicrobiota bacterium]